MPINGSVAQRCHDVSLAMHEDLRGGARVRLVFDHFAAHLPAALSA